MSCFRELYARWPDKLFELCMDEAYEENRLYCWTEDCGVDLCALCDRHAFDDGTHGWHEGKRLCDSPECRELWGWYMVDKASGGYKRRRIFKDHFGKGIFDIEKPLRREAILTAMLTYEAMERAYDQRKTRQRVAA